MCLKNVGETALSAPPRFLGAFSKSSGIKAGDYFLLALCYPTCQFLPLEIAACLGFIVYFGGALYISVL